MEQLEKHIQSEEKVMNHETDFLNRNKNQIRLMVELFENIFKTKVDFQNKEQKNDVVIYWADTGYSKAYRELENSDIFKNHSRLKGDISKITLPDMIEFFEKGSLLE